MDLKDIFRVKSVSEYGLSTQHKIFMGKIF